MTVFGQVAWAFNVVARPLVASSLAQRLLGDRMGVISYTGRRSGQTFSIPVAYRRDGEHLTIGVAVPDQKNWWRNFTGDGGPLALRTQGVDRHGHAVAVRDAQGVRVEVELHPS